jgi:hypothetical protein
MSLYRVVMRIPCDLLLLFCVSLITTGCRTSPDPFPMASGTGGALALANSAGASGSASASLPCIPAATGPKKHPGNFDYESCNTGGCHEGYAGGWLYTDTKGDTFVAGATVTVTDHDGSKLSAVTASDGFFALIGDSGMLGKMAGPYSVCVSKCPDTICAPINHTNPDCQSAGCHGGTTRRIFLTQTSGSANAGSGGTAGCTQLASGGPKTHDAEYDTQACWVCHDKGVYTGGFLYNGITSSTTVSNATVTLTPTSGSPLTAATGPGGMFYFPGTIAAPYTACVSKCESKVCSAADTHTTPDDCRTCHNESNRVYLP